MLSTGLQLQLADATAQYWRAQVSDPEFRAIFKGKEIGHRIADYVDERTSALIEQRFDTRREVDVKGRVRARSMGDIWVGERGIYHPLNVKAGEAGKGGQPNLVSLTKLIDAWLNREIDSYYLMIVKMHHEGNPMDDRRFVIEPLVYFVDMLDYLDFVTFDSGPGQAMLKEKAFYEFMDSGDRVPRLNESQKLERLMDLMEDGDRRLIENRRKKMERLRRQVADYNQQGHHSVNQDGVLLGGGEG